MPDAQPSLIACGPHLPEALSAQSPRHPRHRQAITARTTRHPYCVEVPRSATPAPRPMASPQNTQLRNKPNRCCK